MSPDDYPAASVPSHGGAGLSACVIAMNEEDRIGDCLASLDFCDEIVVVDSHSSDRTREIAAEYGAVVIERDFPGHGAQKLFASQQATHDWVLSIDADERVSPRLREEILALKQAGFPDHSMWRCPRLSAYLGKWIRHGSWYPGHQSRLYDRRRAEWVGLNPHERVSLTSGTSGMLRGDLLHLPYRNLGEHLATIDRYTSLLSDGLAERGRRASLFDVFVRPLWRFVRSFVLRLGFLDGWRGLLLACFEVHYARLKYTKLYVRQHDGFSSPPDIGGSQS